MISCNARNKDVLKAIMVFQMSSHLLITDEGENAEQIMLENLGYDLTEKVLGHPLDDDGDFTDFAQKATAAERAAYIFNNMLLPALRQLEPGAMSVMEHERLYIVAAEGGCTEIDNGELVWCDEEVVEHSLGVWPETQLGTGYGWSETESQELLALQIGHGVTNYGDFAHNIYRIK